MPLHISKNAINNIPLTDENLTNDNIGGILLNEPLSTSKYLVKLAKNDVANQKLGLKYKSFGQHITILKMALTAIDAIYDEYTIPNELIATGIFDINLENAIKTFQGTGIFTANRSIDINGIVDSKTLLAIDAALSQDNIFDYEKKKYVGKVSSRSSFYIGSDISNPHPNYKIIIEGGDEITIEAKPEFGFSYINSGNDDKHVYGVPNEKFQTEIDKHPLVIAKNSKRAIEGIPPIKSIGFAKLDYNLEFANASVPMTNIQNELSKTAPLLFDDNGAKLYKLKEGDTISKIVLDNYYGGGDYAIMDPYNNVPIFTLKERIPFPEDKREDDARFQFYHNLLYYYNSEKKGNEPVNEWGFRTNNYERYTIDHLDMVDIFDNEYKEGNPNTALPNYYRFLKKMEELNAKSKMIFDPLGITTSFTTVPEENIRIPSRQFADTMYYFLNFRHDEMLVKKEPENEASTAMDYIKNEALGDIVDLMSDSMDSLSEIVEEVKEDAVSLYHETVDFFVSAYNFVIQTLVDYWPRGLGGKFGGGIGITWGIPVKTKAKVERSISRKMTKATELTLIYTDEQVFELSVEHVEGFSYGIGQYSGHGRSKKLFGAFAGFEAAAGLTLTQSSEYEFPIRQNETALLTMVMNVFVGQVLQSASKIFTCLESLNLDPKHYITKLEVKYNLGIDAEVGALIGTKLKKGLDIPSSNVEHPTIQNETKSYGSVYNIFEKIPSIGVHGDININAGAAYSYEAEYDDAPYTKGNKGRVFSKIKIENQYYIDAKIDLSLINNIFKSLIPGSEIQPTYIGKLFDKIEFDKKGIMLGTLYEFTRTGSPDSLTSDDFNFSDISYNEDDFTLKYLSGNNVSKEVSLHIGAYSGDADSPKTDGKYRLHMPTFHNMWIAGLDFAFTSIVAFKLFKGLELHKQVGIFDFDGKANNVTISDNSICDKIIQAMKKANIVKMEAKTIVAFVEKFLNHTKTELNLDLKMNIDFNEDSLLKNLLEFQLKKLYLKYVIFEGNKALGQLLETDIKTKKAEIFNELKKQKTEEGKKQYELIYGKKKIPGSNLDSLNLFIDNEISSKGDPDGNYFIVAARFLMGVFNANSYMNNYKLDEDEDYAITEIINLFSFIASLTGFEAKLDSSLNFGLDAEFKGGLFGAVVGGSVEGFVEINYKPTLYENGKIAFLESNDPLKAVFTEIENILEKITDDKRMKVKTLFQVL